MVNTVLAGSPRHRPPYKRIFDDSLHDAGSPPAAKDLRFIDHIVDFVRTIVPERRRIGIRHERDHELPSLRRRPDPRANASHIYCTC